jgi:hypothetical protein
VCLVSNAHFNGFLAWYLQNFLPTSYAYSLNSGASTADRSSLVKLDLSCLGIAALRMIEKLSNKVLLILILVFLSMQSDQMEPLNICTCQQEVKHTIEYAAACSQNI